MGALGPSRGAALSFEGEPARIARLLDEGLELERVEAASALSSLPRADALPLVRRALRDHEPEVRARAVDAASVLGLAEVLDVTRAWLDDDDPALRELAVRAEGELGDGASVQALARALGDPRFSVRREAARALGRLAVEASAPPLGTALDDPDASVRVAAARALGRVPGDDAIRLLVARSLDPALDLRAEVIASLGHRAAAPRGDDRVEAVLMAALDDAALEVRVEAITALGRVRSARAAPLLARLVEREAALPRRDGDDPPTLVAALAALGRIDSASARDALVSGLARGLRGEAVMGALRAAHERAPIELERALAARLEAASSGDTEAVEAIAGALVSLSPLVGSSALARALLDAERSGALEARLLLPALGEALPAPDGPREEASAAGTDEGLVRLLAASASPRDVADALEGLDRAARRGALGARALDVLLLPEVERAARGSDAASDHRAELVRVAAQIDDPRVVSLALRLAEEPSDPLRREALGAIARAREIAPAALERARRVALTSLAALDPASRSAARRILRRHGDEASLAALIDALDAPGSIDRPSVVELVVAIVARLDPARLDPALRARAEERIVSALASSDPRLSSSASAALIGADGALGRALVARAAERVLARGRGGDPLALARLARARGCSSAACGALADRDDEALWASAARSPLDELEAEWRFPEAAQRSYAVLVAARRGALRAEDVARLCALTHRREPAVRANVGLALAALGAACPDVDPVDWIARSHASGVKLAGLAWCAALEGQAGRPGCDPRRLARALDRCLDVEADRAVRASCRALAGHALAAAPLERDALLDVIVLDDDARPLRDRLVTARFEDGAMLTTRTDGSGRIVLRLDRPPPARGAPVIEDPYAMVLER